VVGFQQLICSNQCCVLFSLTVSCWRRTVPGINGMIRAVPVIKVMIRTVAVINGLISGKLTPCQYQISVSGKARSQVLSFLPTINTAGRWNRDDSVWCILTFSRKLRARISDRY
jgi:hypothetical protein